MVRVLVAGALGVIVAAVAALFLPWQVSSLLGWDTTAIAFCVWVWSATRGSDAATTHRHAIREDDSRRAAELVLIAACIASLAGVAVALLLASTETGLSRTLTTGVVVLTVGVSWLAVHTQYALRYAHLYYRDGGGIDFHNERPPDYGDFAYVAFTLGMTYQVSDTDLTTKAIRKTALRHALISYVFGISVIAVMINVVAGLLSR